MRENLKTRSNDYSVHIKYRGCRRCTAGVAPGWFWVTQCTLPARYRKPTFGNMVAVGIFMRFLLVHKQRSSTLFYENR